MSRLRWPSRRFTAGTVFGIAAASFAFHHPEAAVMHLLILLWFVKPGPATPTPPEDR